VGKRAWDDKAGKAKNMNRMELKKAKGVTRDMEREGDRGRERKRITHVAEQEEDHDHVAERSKSTTILPHKYIVQAGTEGSD